jgi:hypothetical protein
MRKKTATAVLLCMLFMFSKFAIPQQAAGRAGDLLDKMAGTWKVEGHVRTSPAHHTITAEWILNKQFLRLHEITSPDAPAPEKRYDAWWFIGYDAVSERYVVHLLDIFGPRYSETLGYGTRKGNVIAFVFEYPDGPFHTTVEYLPESGAWRWLLEQREKGQWTEFADFKLTRVPQPR